MGTALVTGAAGFVGSHLVDGLLREGYRVRGLDDLSSGDRDNLAEAWRSEAFEFVEGDVRDAGALQRAMDDVDVVFHQGAVTSVPRSIDNPGHVTDVNCTGTARVLESAIDADVERVIFASSAAVYGSDVDLPASEDAPTDPESPYALSKYYGEELATQYARRDDIDALSLRYFNVYGPRQDPAGEYAAVVPAFIRRLQNGEPPVIYGDGKQTRDFVHVSDVVAANILAATTDTDSLVFNVGRGSRTSVEQLATTLIGLFDTDLQPTYRSERMGDVRHSEADISSARSELGYRPERSLTDGLRETVAYFENDC